MKEVKLYQRALLSFNFDSKIKFPEGTKKISLHNYFDDIVYYFDKQIVFKYEAWENVDSDTIYNLKDEIKYTEKMIESKGLRHNISVFESPEKEALERVIELNKDDWQEISINTAKFIINADKIVFPWIE